MKIQTFYLNGEGYDEEINEWLKENNSIRIISHKIASCKHGGFYIQFLYEKDNKMDDMTEFLKDL